MSLTLRTPTLDDVFLQLTGSHLQDERPEGPGDRPSTPTTRDRQLAGHRRAEGAMDLMVSTTNAPTTALAGPGPPGGFFVDVASVARRAIRQIPASPRRSSPP